MREYKQRKLRRKKTIQRLLSLLLVCSMLFPDILTIMPEVQAADGLQSAPPVTVTFQSAGDSNTMYTDDGDIMLSMGNSASVGVLLNPTWNTQDGYANKTRITMRLPLLYYDSEGVLHQAYYRSAIPAGSVVIGGIEANFTATSESTAWYAVSPQMNTEVEAGEGYDATNNSGYRRVLFEIQSTESAQFNEARSFNVSFRFFKYDVDETKLPEGKKPGIPENTKVKILLGASYDDFTVTPLGGASYNLGEGYLTLPGPGGENDSEGVVRDLGIINTNLKWNADVEMEHLPVLWDQYNYAVYKVKIKNTSENDESIIDNFIFMLNVPNFNNNQKGVLDEDMMAWFYNEETGVLEPNEEQDTSTEAKQNLFGGKYQEGGALIWDMTDRGEPTDFNLHEFASANPSEFPYLYAQSGQIGVQLTEEEVIKDEERIYYVAVPYVNNFGQDYNHKVDLNETVYFGGRGYAWTKKDSAEGAFVLQNVSLTHEKYVEKDADATHYNSDDYYLGTDDIYYLGNFSTESNTPVFNSYVIDTLPNYFDLKGLTIEMAGQSSELKNWFWTDEDTGTCDILDLTFLKFMVDGQETWLSLRELGATSATLQYDSVNDKNVWTITGIDQAMEAYLTDSDHPARADYEFAGEIKILFKHRIEIGEKFDGRIGIIGSGKYLLDYPNTLNTYFERWNWQQATADKPAGYFTEVLHINDPAIAVLEGKPAEPLVGPQGVYYVTEDDGTITSYINTETGTDGNKFQPVSIGLPNAAVRYELGTGNESIILPGTFSIDNFLEEDTTTGKWEGLQVESIELNAGLLAVSKIDAITFTYTDGTTQTIAWEDIESSPYYDNTSGSGVISKDLWSYAPPTTTNPKPTPINLDITGVEVRFGEFKGSVPLTDAEDAYIEFKGTPNKVKKLYIEGTFSTLYNEHPAVAAKKDVEEDVAIGVAILDVREVIPTIEATANWKEDSSNAVTNPLVVPNDVNTLHPDAPAYYEFKVGNDSLAQADNVHLTLDFLSVKDIDLSSGEVIKGFDTDKIVLKAGYANVIKIDSIQLFDYDDDPTADTPTPSVTITKDQLSTYINTDGDLVIDLSKFASEIDILKAIRFVVKSFAADIKGDDRLVIQAYGNTDGYNNYYDTKRLEASLTFEPVGIVYGTEDVVVASAAFSVVAPTLDIHNDIYQYNVTSVSAASTSNTDKTEMILGVPYARDFTYRVELRNDKISVIDDVVTTIDLPDYVPYNGNGVIEDAGFHPTSIIIYKDLLDQYKNFNGIAFEIEMTLVTALRNVLSFGDGTLATYDKNLLSAEDEPLVTYDKAAQTLEYKEKTYNLDSTGKYFEIPIGDILEDGEKLQQIILEGQDFAISTGKDITPYLEINGWSDSKIETKDVLTTDAVNYLDALRDNTPVYSVTSKDTSVAYISQMYYDTTIVAGFNTGDTTVRYQRYSTPAEDVRMQYKVGGYANFWNDNVELEVGYKALGSYAVDFSQHLDKTAALPTTDGGEYTQEQDGMKYIKSTSYNTAATVKMNVSLPHTYFDTYYLKIDDRTKDYIESITIKRQDGTETAIPLEEIDWKDGFGLISLIQKDVVATADGTDGSESTGGDGTGGDGTETPVEPEKPVDFFSTNYYKEPTTDYKAVNPVTGAVIVLKINQEGENTDTDGNKTANNPDYGTWWEDSNESSKYMFEFNGRFYRVGTAAAANVSTELTIGGDNDKLHDSIQRKTSGSAGSSAKNSGDSWSFKNYYKAYSWGGSVWNNAYEYKADDLYSSTNAVVVRDYNRTIKSATSWNNTIDDINTTAQIGAANQYLIDFYRCTRTDRYNNTTNEFKYHNYEATSLDTGLNKGNWKYQDEDDWKWYVGYADKVSIVDDLGHIETDPTYKYKGTLTTGLRISEQIYNHLHEDEAIKLTLGTGTTNSAQDLNQRTFIVPKSKLQQDGSYYVMKFDNSEDEAATPTVTEPYWDGNVLHLMKNQYPMKFEVIMWDIKGDGEYLKDVGLKFSEADFSFSPDIVVDVVPYSVYGVDDRGNTRNHVTSKTYEDYDGYNTASDSIMFNSSSYSWTEDMSAIMGYRKPFKAGQQLISMGRTEIDQKDEARADGVTTITDYRVDDDPYEYTKIDPTNPTGTGVSYAREENLTPTNAQFGAKIYNEYVNSTIDKEIPVRIRQLVSKNTMNTYYRMRNLYIPIQWIKTGTVDTDNPTAYGQWFHISGIEMYINGDKYTLTPNGTGTEIVVKNASNTRVGTIPLNVEKTIYGKDDTDGVPCYVLNIEDFARDNMDTCPDLVNTRKNGLIEVNVGSFNITFTATSWDLDNDNSMLKNGDYLTANKSDGYAFYYDGVYVERSNADHNDGACNDLVCLKHDNDFTNDYWTIHSQPTFGMQGNNYSPTYSNSGRTLTNSIDTTFTAADVNADTFFNIGSKTASYNVRNAVAILTPEITKVRKDDAGNSLFAYDLDDSDEDIEVDIDHLLPYDYIEYTVTSGSHKDSEILLTRNNLEFVVPKGQQIVRWELVSTTMKNARTTALVTTDDIVATLYDSAGTALNNVAPNKNYSALEETTVITDKNTATNTYYRKIKFVIGDMGTVVEPGDKIVLRIITQLTDELAGSATSESKSMESNAYYYAEKQHGFSQYAIDGYNETDYVTGYQSSPVANSTSDGYDRRADVNSSDIVYCFRHYNYITGTYVAQLENTLTFYNNKDVKPEFSFDSSAREYEGQGAKITVSDIKNDTMHYLREQTVTVDFVDKWGDQGFHLTELPKPTISKADGGDIYYPDEFINVMNGLDVDIRDILVECRIDAVDESGATVDKWLKAAEIEVLVASGDLTYRDITAIRWTYYDLLPGYDQSNTVYKEAMTFDPVVLVGYAEYEDIRISHKLGTNTVMADRYDGVFTATITHIHEHDENIKVVVDNTTGEGKELVRNADVYLTNTTSDTEKIWREVPQVILHPQVFDNKPAVAEDTKPTANNAYDENATQKIGYRPNQKYWQQVTLINREMVDANNKQNARMGRLIEPVFYDKFPVDYLSVVDGTMGVAWYDIDGNLKTGDYKVQVDVAAQGEYEDYGGAMAYKKTKVQDVGTSNTAFADFVIDAAHTYETTYEMRTYTIVDGEGNPITLDVGDTLILYYQLQVAEDGLPMVYVDEDANLNTDTDRNPGYFPRMGEYFQVGENSSFGDGRGYPFASDDPGDEVHYRQIKNQNLLMDMDYLLHDIGVTGTLNEFVDRWEYLKDSIVFIPGTDKTQHWSSYEDFYYDGDNGVLSDYDISSSSNMQKTIYTPSTNTPYGEDKNELPDSHTLLHPNPSGGTPKPRDWYELVVAKRIKDAENWGNYAPIIWGENRLHLQKAWLLGASEFVSTDNEQRKYEATTGDGLENNRASNPNYNIDNYYPENSYYNQKNYLHSLTNDNFETALEYNQKFTTKLQVLNYGDWDLTEGVEIIYTLPAGMEPEIFGEDGNVDLSKIKVDILQSSTVTGNETQTETFTTLKDGYEVEVIQRPTDDASYLAPTEAQDPLWQGTTLKEDYPEGEDTTPWVLRIVVNKNLNQWFGRGTESGYKFYLYIPTHVVRTNDNEEWFDRMQVRPYVPEQTEESGEKYEDYYYYQIFDIDHWEGLTRDHKMQHNQRYGMDYLWYRGNYGSIGFSHNTYTYYNGSMNTPYINGYNIQNQEVTVTEEDGIYKATAVKNNYDYGDADDIARYAQTGTRAVMRKPLLRQWTTVGDDIDGSTLSDYYIDTEVDNVLFNIHVENQYYWDKHGTNGYWINNSGQDYWTDTTKEEHSYATDGGYKGTYILPVITNILPYGIAPVGEYVGEDGELKKDIFSTYNEKNAHLTLSWDLKGLAGEALNDDGAEKALYESKVTFEQIARTDAEGDPILDEDGKAVTEGRFVVRIYAKAAANAGDTALEARIEARSGRTFSFETYTYDAPKLDTLSGEDNPDLADFYENNYTYISSKIDNFKGLIDEDIKGNPYTVGSTPYLRYRYPYDNANYTSFHVTDSRLDAIKKTYQPGYASNGTAYDVARTYGFLPNSLVKDTVTGTSHYVIGQGMERVEEPGKDELNNAIYNIEDYIHDTAKNQIRDYLVIGQALTDFNQNGTEDGLHYDYAGGTKVADIAFVNTTKVRTKHANMTLNYYVGKDSKEPGVETPTLDSKGNENVPGSVEYKDKTFDYGDEVWYTARVENTSVDKNDYSRQGSIHHVRFVFSFYLPKTVTYVGDEAWDQWKPDDFVLELKNPSTGEVTTVTPETLEDSGWGIRVINRQYLDQSDGTASPVDDHTGQVVTFEVVTAADEGFTDYSSYAAGLKPAGHFAYGDILTFKIRTRVDNKEWEGIDPSVGTPDVWTGYYSEVYTTFHTTNGEYIITDKGNIYNDDERNQITSEEIAFDGYEINRNAIEKYGFPMQHQEIKTVDIRDKEVADERDETDGDKLIVDYDRDGDYDSNYGYASSGYISVWIPEASVRIDTDEVRVVISDANVTNELIDDAHARSSSIMDIRLTQAKNEQANVNEYVVNLDIPYRGTNKGGSQIADLNAAAMATTLKEIRTGNWELPENCDNVEVYEEHLKVYVYGLVVNDPWDIYGYESPYEQLTGAQWIQIGAEAGYALNNFIDPNTGIANTGNAVISQDEIDAAIQKFSGYGSGNYGKDSARIYQLKWVVRMEGFTETYTDEESGDSYTEVYTQEEAAINYPVPKGLRLAIDSEGVDNREINDSDPLEKNTVEEIMHHKGVVDNCAYVSINTQMRDTTDGVLKHVNFFVTTYARYDDHKTTSISKINRAGYYVDPELPTLGIEYEQGYFKGALKYDENGKAYSTYAWDYNNAAIDVDASNTLKYRVTLQNLKINEEQGIEIEDNTTNPIVSIALPYNEVLDVAQLQYVDYESPDNYLRDDYTSRSSLKNARPLWTWYITDEEGNIVESTGMQALEVTEESPLQTNKKLSVYRSEKSKIFNFYFTGQLKPGEYLKVELMVPILRMNASTTSDELLRSKAYCSKEGAFTAYTPDTGAVNAAAYEYDSQDINENGMIRDTCITKETAALTFTTIDALGQSKLVDTDLETNQSSRPAAVTEAGTYTFKASNINQTNTMGYEYTRNVIFDVLPYDDDNYAYVTTNKDGENVAYARGSKWNGWLDIESIAVKETKGNVVGAEVAKDQYTIWVGPIVKENGKYKLNYDSDNRPIVPDPVTVMQNEEELKNLADNDAEKEKYFVKLDELKTYISGKDVTAEEEENLLKGIRSIWVQMNPDYVLSGLARLELSYDMRVPQNIPKYVGTVVVDETSEVAPDEQVRAAVKDYMGINTFLTRGYKASGNGTYSNYESANASVYVDAPSNKGYIGSYVWTDVDFDALIDEGTYADTYGIGRDLLEMPFYDLDGDKVADDPGINGVLVELLSKNGRPVNKDGQAVIDAYEYTKDPGDIGKWLVLNDETGTPLLVNEGEPTERYTFSSYGPVSFITESDYYGNKGYFVLTDLKPGDYNLRYTFPDIYEDYSVSTKELNSAANNKTGEDINTPVIVYRDGEVVYNAADSLTNTAKSDAQQAAYAVKKGTLVVQTAECVQVKAVEEDQTTVDENGMTPHERYDRLSMGYSVGVGATRFYKGNTWLDEKTIDGIMGDDEERLEVIRIEAYEVEVDPVTGDVVSKKPATTADGQPAVFVTSKIPDTIDNVKVEAGQFVFRLVPGKTYVLQATNLSPTTVLKPTKPIFSNDPLDDTTYNDLLIGDGVNTTRPFYAVYIEGENVEGWDTFHEEHTIDLGFVNSARGFIGEFVWDDKDYDGIQDIDELPIEGVTVTLESYYYDSDNDTWVSAGDDQKAQTNAAGIFKYTVNTFYSKDNKQYLMGYKVRIDRDDNEALFQTHGATWKDKAQDGTQSDMDEYGDSQGRYYLTDEPVLAAKLAGSETYPENKLSYDGKEYDIANAVTVDLDAGFKSYEAGALDGILWLDADYDGIREQDEIVADPSNLTDDEKNLEKIEVLLDSYYYDGSTWTKIKEAEVTSNLTLGTDQFYHYYFDDLDTFYNLKGKTYLKGYKVRLKSDTVDDTLRQTLRHQGTDDKIDSNLLSDEKTFQLNDENEYIILAAKRTQGTDVLHGATVLWGENTYYDMHVKRDMATYDAGFKRAEVSSISGNIWIDLNYDGIMNDQMPRDYRLADKEIILKRYVVSEEKDKLVYTEDPFGIQTTTTDPHGAYEFTDIQNYYVDEKGATHLYAYKVAVDDEQFEGDIYCGMTKLHQGSDSTLDSDWQRDTSLRPNECEYLILLNKADGNTPSDNIVSGYHVVSASNYKALNAGVGVIQLGKISGTIFDDKDYNGVFDEDEVGREGITINLVQYTKVPGEDTYQMTGGVFNTVTDEDGNYEFSDLPAFGLNLEDENVLYAYRVVVDGDTLPAGYKVTKYLAAEEGRLSHLDKKTFELLCDEEVRFTGSEEPYIILANETKDTQVTNYQDGYDMADGIHVTELDGGITNYRPEGGSISGIIFNDSDKDGIFDIHENGKKDITIILTQYMKAPGEDIYEATGGAFTTVTDEDGYYEFVNLPVFGLNMEDELALYAYRVTVLGESIPQGYEITKYLVNEPGRVSRLDSETLELICSEEVRFAGSTQPYIILAGQTEDTEVLYYHEGYDMGDSIHVNSLDGGITDYRPEGSDQGKISGTIFNDKDRDGIFDANEEGKKNIIIVLTQYMKVPGEDVYEATGGVSATVTDKDGYYEFANLPVFGRNMEEELALYAYRITVFEESIPEDWVITKYLADEAGRVSRLDSKTLELISSEEVHFAGSTQPYIILAEKTEDIEVPLYHEGYDMGESIHVEELDGGIFKEELESIFTGDDAMLWLFAVLCLGSLITTLVVLKKRKKQ